MPLSPEELALRPNTLGSSEIAAVLGINEYATPHNVWMAKMGLATFEGNDATVAGNDFEPVILMRAARHNELTLRPGHRVVGPEDWMSATPDAFIEGGGLVEAKMVGIRQVYSWGAGEDEVPYPYLCQVQWQLLVTGEPFCIVAAQMGTEHRYYRIKPDAELQKIIMDRCRAWWHRYVVTKTPPPVDGSEAAKEMLIKLHPRSEQAFRYAEENETELAKRLIAARAVADKANDEVSLVENLLRQAAGDYEKIQGEGWRIRYKTSKNGKRPFIFELDKKAEIAA